jgi:dTDP-4-dehydrorhamnose 3,5-epimerase
VPEGFAHGFQALENNTRVHYKVTDYWSKESEKSLNFMDPEVGIRWPIEVSKVSEKDALAPSLKDIR